MGDILSDVEAFISFSGVAASRLGRAAVNDPAFVTGLRRGREPRQATVRRVRAWMARERAAADPADPAELRPW